MAIAILPPELVNKIAAGEVVERPSSVVKELLENSLDAKARNIEVEILSGGLELIRVSDDGLGLSPKDVGLAILPHATSKISRYEDLLEVKSYGFRGEALSSIASVSQLTITSRTPQDQLAYRASWRYGQFEGGQEAGAASGTTVEVWHLFGNVPARKKFLRSPATEYRRCLEEMLYQALPNPQVSFRLINQGRMALDLPAAGPEDRWRQVLSASMPT